MSVARNPLEGFTVEDVRRFPERVELVGGQLLLHGSWTAEDLARMPDDGNRYELLGGVVVVTPAPGVDHQECVAQLLVRLRAAAPPSLRVLPAPVDWRIGQEQVVQPDLLVVARDATRGQQTVTTTPELVVEVLSASTRHTDRGSKRLLYAEAGVGWYWLVDPTVPSVEVLELFERGYRQVAFASGTGLLTLHAPFEIELAPALLLG
jgi:Uma2 family endonuclease